MRWAADGAGDGGSGYGADMSPLEANAAAGWMTGSGTRERGGMCGELWGRARGRAARCCCGSRTPPWRRSSRRQCAPARERRGKTAGPGTISRPPPPAAAFHASRKVTSAARQVRRFEGGEDRGISRAFSRIPTIPDLSTSAWRKLTTPMTLHTCADRRVRRRACA